MFIVMIAPPQRGGLEIVPGRYAGRWEILFEAFVLFNNTQLLFVWALLDRANEENLVQAVAHQSHVIQELKLGKAGSSRQAPSLERETTVSRSASDQL